VQISKLGGKCILLTRVSDDALGKYTINELRKYNVNTDLIKFEKDESRISLAVVESTNKDHQSIIYRHNASDLFMNKKDILNTNINNFSCLIFTGTALASEPSRSSTFLALEIAKKNNIPIIQDIDYRPYTWKSKKIASEVYIKSLEFTDILIGNDDEFGILAKDYNRGLELAESLCKEIEIVIYKKGQMGSISFINKKKIIKGVYNVKVLKPTGAGDAFLGSFIGGILNDNNLEKSLEIGSASAAIVVTKVGCSHAMPSFEDINKFMYKNKMLN
jgi:Sugar kinases, ribokinase family